MRPKFNTTETLSERLVRDIRRATGKAVFGGGEDPHRPRRLARRSHYRRTLPPGRDRRKPLLQLVKRVLRSRQAAFGRRHGPIGTTSEVKDLKSQALELKEVVAEQALELRLLKKSMTGDGEDEA